MTEQLKLMKFTNMGKDRNNNKAMVIINKARRLNISIYYFQRIGALVYLCITILICMAKPTILRKDKAGKDNLFYLSSSFSLYN